MKINEKSNAILSMIKGSFLDKLIVTAEDFENLKIKKPDIDLLWSCIVPDIEKNIRYVTTPFMEAISEASQKMLSPEVCEIIPDKPDFGVFICRGSVLCYWIMPNSKGGFSLVYFRFGAFKEHNNLILEAHFNMSVDKDIKGKSSYYFSSTETKSKTPEELFKLENSALKAMLNFVKYAEIETKILAPKKTEYFANCKYENETLKPITILDSKWFTTLVKSDAFKVRGHFRLQPHKVGGEWTKKLIWINDFEKSGYTAPAQKLNVN